MKKNESIEKVLTRKVVTAHLGQSISEVRKVLAKGGFHHIPVVSGSQLIGLISASDILKRLVVPFENEAREKGIDLTVEDETDGALVSANARDIRRAVRALVENALKFTPEEGALILSDEQREELERFSDQRIETRKRLREVRHQQAKDIEALGTRLKLANSGLIPLLLVVTAVAVSSNRRRKLGGTP